jgi:hypothetical protein
MASHTQHHRILRSLAGWRRRSKLAAAVAILALFAGALLWVLRVGTHTPHPKLLTAPRQVAQTPVGLSGSEWLEQQYAKVDPGDESARHLLVLEQVARHNMPDTWDDWVTVTVHGRKGTVVEFEVSPHALRIGTNQDWVEVPLDGPHAAAAAEILGHTLCTAWMVEQVYAQAKKHGGAIHYFAAAEIATSLGLQGWNNDVPDGEKMKSPEFFQQRSILLQNWLNDHAIAPGTLVAGYFKTVVPPVDGLTRHGGLEMLGGHTDQGEKIQSLSGGFHGRIFFDYSHNIRLVKNGIRVQGQAMTLTEFFSSTKYAFEFGFQRTMVPDRAYPYPPALADWMESHGYLKAPLDVEAAKTEARPSRG